MESVANVFSHVSNQPGLIHWSKPFILLATFTLIVLFIIALKKLRFDRVGLPSGLDEERRSIIPMMNTNIEDDLLLLMGQRLSRKEKKQSSCLELSRIPSHLWIEILKKTNTGSFPKLYRSCKEVKTLIDEGQMNIRIHTSRILEISVKKQNGQAVTIYTIRPSWFGDGITCRLKTEETISQHFLLLSCFRLTKLSFISLEEDSPEIKSWIKQELSDSRVQAEKLSFGQYGYSYSLQRQLKATALEITDNFLITEEHSRNTHGIKSLTLRLEQLSSLNLEKSFQEYLPKYEHVDILGNKQSDERLFTETFILLQKMAFDKCDTRCMKLIVFHHKFSSVELFIRQLRLNSRLVLCDEHNFFFSMSRKSLLGSVLIYLYCEKEVKIRMKVCKTERNDAAINFLCGGIPIDQSNARFLLEVSKKIVEDI